MTAVNQSRQDVVIIIPAYNASRTIAETLQSVQNQAGGLDRVQYVLIADDASTDDTVAVAEREWHCKVPLQITRNLANRGERQTMNAAVGALDDSVKWFFIIHADDLGKPDWLPVMLQAIDASDDRIASITASYDVLYEDGHIVHGEQRQPDCTEVVPGTPGSVRSTLDRGCWWKVSSCCIRVKTYRELGGFDPEMPHYGDWDFCLRALAQGWSIVYVPMSLSVYRQTAGNLSSRCFRVHRDIVERLIVLNRFRSFLTTAELTSHHARCMGLLVRRAGASLLRGHFGRLTSGLSLMPNVVRSLTQSVWATGSPAVASRISK